MCSSLLALRRKLGVISQWKHLVAKLPECVHHFNVKLLGTHNGDAAAAAAAAAKSDTVDWSVEARSAEWQCFARAWNEMVLQVTGLHCHHHLHLHLSPPPSPLQLRFNDNLSNEERDELLFPLLSGRDCEAFFDVPEYVIFPTMLTAPALAPSAWQHGKRAYASFERSLLQMRDLVVWLLVQLGIVTMDQKMHVLDIITKMARLQVTGRHRHRLHHSRLQLTSSTSPHPSPLGSRRSTTTRSGRRRPRCSSCARRSSPSSST